MKPSAIVMVLCLAALVAGGQAAFKNPCTSHAETFPTTVDSLQGIWKGSCTSLTAPVDPTNPNTPFQCALQPFTYDYTIVYNGTAAGVNISGFVVPLGNAHILNSSPTDAGARLLLLNLTLFPGYTVQGMIHTTVTCHKGKPTYREIAVHVLANPNGPTTFPPPMKRDTIQWCNKKSIEYQGHAPASFNIICTNTRIGDAPASWP